MENEANAHVCRRFIAVTFAVWLYIKLPISMTAFWGVSCLCLFVVGSREPQVDRCIQLHAFFVLIGEGDCK